MEFRKAFNAQTQEQAGLVIPVVITVYADRSFSFITKTPPAAVFLLRAAKLSKGSGVPNRDKVGKVSPTKVREIAELEMPDLNASSIESAMSMIAGTARSMGLLKNSAEDRTRGLRLWPEVKKIFAGVGKLRPRQGIHY